MSMNLVINDLDMAEELDRDAMVELTGRGYSFGNWYNIGAPTVQAGSYSQGAWNTHSIVKLFGIPIYLLKVRYDHRTVQTRQRRRVTYEQWF